MSSASASSSRQQGLKRRTMRSWSPFQAFGFSLSSWSTLMTTKMKRLDCCVQLTGVSFLKWSSC